MIERVIRVLRGPPELLPWEHSYRWMRDFTDSRGAATADELWVLQHPPIYTLGQAATLDHLHDAGQTPVVRTDRGGEVTWHGPGQVVLYALVDLRRAGIGVRAFVTCLERCMVDLLARRGIPAQARKDAPGVYLSTDGGAPGAKIGALGVRVRRGRTYHGLAFNVAPDLQAFAGINPCGLRGQSVARLMDLSGEEDVFAVGVELAGLLRDRLAAEQPG